MLLHKSAIPQVVPAIYGILFSGRTRGILLQQLLYKVRECRYGKQYNNEFTGKREPLVLIAQPSERAYGTDEGDDEQEENPDFFLVLP